MTKKINRPFNFLRTWPGFFLFHIVFLVLLILVFIYLPDVALGAMIAIWPPIIFKTYNSWINIPKLKYDLEIEGVNKQDLVVCSISSSNGSEEPNQGNYQTGRDIDSNQRTSSAGAVDASLSRNREQPNISASGTALSNSFSERNNEEIMISLSQDDEIGDKKYCKREYLRLLVKNNGKKTAKKCLVKVKVLNRPEENDEDCNAPSREYKTWMGLTWAGEDKVKKDIPPKCNAIADVLFKQYFEDEDGEIVEEITSTNFEGSDLFGQIIAFFSTLEATINPNKRLQDGLCEKEYKIEIGIFPKNGNPLIKEFTLTVDSEWDNTSLDNNPSHF